MTLKELREKYQASQTRQAINRAIRAEIPGGNEILDNLEYWHRLATSKGWKYPNGEPTMPAVAYHQYLNLAEIAETEIRARYGIGQATKPKEG